MSGSSITFIVPGHGQSAAEGATRGAAAMALPLPQGMARGQVKHSVRVGTQRGTAAEVRVTAEPGKDVVVIHIAGGPALVLHPETARDLMLAQSERKRSGNEAGPGEVRVPAQLEWRGLEQGAAARGATRGFLGDVLVSAVEVLTGVAREQVAELAADEVVKHFDQHVRAGVYALNAATLPKPGDGGALAGEIGAPAGSTLLVLVHGTFSDTLGTFGKFWVQHPQRVAALFEHYGGRVYALEHPTLGVSPVGNALALAEKLPAGARVHLLTHSRGGLVAEALARACAMSAADFKEAASLYAGKANEPQLEELNQLAALAKRKGIAVERVVRVACPARGTLLASGRLDAYLSVFKWTLEVAGIPVAPALVDFLGEVAQYRTDPKKIPGLAALIPEGPFLQWLHAVEDAIPGTLRVVAGDIAGDSVTSWLKTLLADSFFWTDNDFVVQTRSMYGGAPRAGGASFLLDQSGEVSHFKYFENERTAEAIVHGLLQDAPSGFRLIGPLSWAGEFSTGVRAAKRGADDGMPLSAKPAVFLLPGILGSNLKVNGKRVWLNWRVINGLKLLKYGDGAADGVEPDEPIGMFYDDLGEFLSRTHEVIEFAFDWRRPIEAEARRLADEVAKALDAREANGQPVRMIAHSMGGIVARTVQLERPDVWQRMMTRGGARLLMLGTPNGGSWAPMQVLSGDDTFGNTLVAIGAPFQDHKARELMAEFPGFIQLQAGLLDVSLGLDRPGKWQDLADADLKAVEQHNWWHSDETQLRQYRWGVPTADVLARAVELRGRLDRQRDDDLPGFKDKLALVVGNARFTPDGYEIGDQGLVYLDALEAGDGRVTLQSALLPGVRTWKLDCEHGDLPRQASAFDAYLELLETGTTARLAVWAGTGETRGAAGAPAPVARVKNRPSRVSMSSRPPESERQVLDTPAREPAAAGKPALGPALRVSVVNGDLLFVRQPLMLGHYYSSRLTGTERAMNALIGGAMQESLDLQLYPGALGRHQVFHNTRTNPENPWTVPRPEAVIVVGLGEEGKLRPAEIPPAICQAVLAWSQRIAEKSAQTLVETDFELAATLIGSGGIGISPGQSAQLVAQGVREANDRLEEYRRKQRGAARGTEERLVWPRVRHLYLIELYLDRAGDAWRALQFMVAAAHGRYVLTDHVQRSTGAMTRPIESDYRGADYDFILAQGQTGTNGESMIAYTLDTRRARTEVTAQKMQAPLLRQLVARASNDANRDPQIGRTLFQLLVPVEVEPFLAGSTDMVIELDDSTAGIPWELLDTTTRGTGEDEPWAIRTKLLRKLATDRPRPQLTDASADARILVIGEPKCDLQVYPRLPAARAEAIAVRDRFKAAGALPPDRVMSLISADSAADGPDAHLVINTLLSQDWRIVHISGHGEPPGAGSSGGVVLSNGLYLGPAEIRSMRVVPELVFVNCCHLAASDLQQVLAQDNPGKGRPFDRAAFAASVARELIDMGVRCVIAAGWAVEDDPAGIFATTFYESLLAGQRFIDAVARARTAARRPNSNTWAAYQCYGDPDWYLRREGADPQRPAPSITEEFNAVASRFGLVLALETLAVRSEFQKAPRNEQQAKLRHMEARFGPRWGSAGDVAEGFGKAWAAAGDRARAVTWYEKAVAANDGSATIRAAEQLGDLRALLAWDEVRNAQQKGGVPRALLRKARDEIKAGFGFLEQLARLQPSIERYALCGSACKRLALLARLENDDALFHAEIRSMQEHYQKAEKLAHEQGHPQLFYPALNCICAGLALSERAPDWGKRHSSRHDEVHRVLEARTRDDPDFWSVAGLMELRLYDAIAHDALAPRLESIQREYADLHARVSVPGNWSSLYDQLLLLLPAYAQRAAAPEKHAADALLAFVRALLDAP